MDEMGLPGDRKAAHLKEIRDEPEASVATLRPVAQVVLEIMQHPMHVTQCFIWPRRVPSFQEAGKIALHKPPPNPQVFMYLEIAPDQAQPACVGGLKDPEAGGVADEDVILTLAGVLIWTHSGCRTVLPFGSIGGDMTMDIDMQMPVTFCAPEALLDGMPFPANSSVLLRGPDFRPVVPKEAVPWLPHQTILLTRLAMGLVDDLHQDGL